MSCRIAKDINQLVTDDCHSLVAESIEREVLLSKWLKALPDLIDIDKIKKSMMMKKINVCD